MVLKNSCLFFNQKAQSLVHLGPYDLAQISSACGPNCVSNNVWIDFTLPLVAFETVARERFNGKFTAKIDFPIEHFMLPNTDAEIGSLKSFHTLFDTYLDHMLVKFEKIVRYEIYKILIFLAKYG